MKSLIVACVATIILASSAATSETIQTQRAVVSADLDGNGTDDYVAFEIEYIPTSPDRFHLTINGVRSSFPGSSLTGEIRVVDIDSTDRFLELAIPEEGPSDDYKSYFFRYIDGALVAMGSLPGQLTGDSASLSVNGGGTVIANCRGRVLHTWFYTCKYRVNESHRFEMVQEPFYQMGAELKLKDRLVLLAGPGSEEVVALLNSGVRITVLGSDDLKWCQAETKEHVIGWFELNNRGWGLVDGRSVNSVFEGLCSAD